MKKHGRKMEQERVMTAIVGSYPKPRYLLRSSGRKLLDDMGRTLYEEAQKVGAVEFEQHADRAALMAIREQNKAGLDLVTDGEERRGHYVMDILRMLDGFDFEHMKPKSIREGNYIRELPVVVGKIAYRRPILVDEFAFTQKHASGIPKIGLPGPAVVVDSVVDEYYHGNLENMAFDYAQAIRHEVKNLIDAGCQVVQFDDPALLRYPEQARQWGLKALQACFEGLESQATYIVHICRGYPDAQLERKGIDYKTKAERYEEVLKWLSESTLDIVSIEGAQSNLDLSLLAALGKKKVMLGVLDVGSNEVESVESLIERGQEALRYLPKEQLILAPDCGMLQLSQKAAKQKLVNLTAATSKLNGSG